MKYLIKFCRTNAEVEANDVVEAIEKARILFFDGELYCEVTSVEQVKDKEVKGKVEKYIIHQHFDSYIEVEVEAGNPEEAMELARPLLEDMPNEEFDRQLVANAEADSELGIS